MEEHFFLDKCDIVVCGTGTAGTCAALRAAELGADVVVLEGNSFVGGTSRITEGLFGVGDRLSESMGIEESAEKIIEAALEYSHHASNELVLKKYIHSAGATINWLMDNGIGFTRIISLGGSPRTWHAFEEGKLVGEMLIDPLIEKSKSLGARFYLNTRVKDLYIEDERIAGVIVALADGSQSVVRAGAVVTCCGGYADNAEMFDEFTGHDHSRYAAQGVPGRYGEGVAMGRKVGAALHIPGCVMYNGGKVTGTKSWCEPLNLAFYRQFNVRVNEAGRRFFNEGNLRDFTLYGNAIAAQVRTVSLFDQEFLDILVNDGIFYGTQTMGIPDGAPLANLPELIEKSDGVVVADTLEEIAELTGVDVNGLKDEMARYNAFCEAGYDGDFGKSPKYLHPVSKPPYYAAVLTPTYFTTVGGLKVDDCMRVVSADGRPILGLYACGSDAGGVYGHCYDLKAAAGSQQGWAATSGRLAAEHAAEKYLALS